MGPRATTAGTPRDCFAKTTPYVGNVESSLSLKSSKPGPRMFVAGGVMRSPSRPRALAALMKARCVLQCWLLRASRRLAADWRLMFGNQQRAPVKRANLIIPVPLHPDRERERGFNQANLLARELSRLTKLQLNEHAIIRDVHTERHRAGMDSRARRDSVENAFRVRRPQIIAGRRVLLVDDVFTTGATVSACAAVLKKAGAEEVFVLTVARA